MYIDDKDKLEASENAQEQKAATEGSSVDETTGAEVKPDQGDAKEDSAKESA